MTRVYIDAETFSSVDLPNRGLANYWDPAADTGVHCIAWKIDAGPIQLWKNGQDFPVELDEFMLGDGLIVAHKAEFEYYMLQKFYMTSRGHSPLTLDRMRCTMAKAAAMAFPLSLGKLSMALGFPQGKDTAGMKAMRTLCKPNPATGRHWRYEDAPALFEDLYRYCVHDVQLEYDIDQILPDLSDAEQAMWILDQQINRRGIGVDRPAAAAAYQICTREIDRLDNEIRTVSGGKVDSTKAVLQIARFCGMDSVAKANIEEALDCGVAENAAPLNICQDKVLRIRQEAAKSSVLKLKPMLELCGADGRVRWTQQFNGAGTGRWSGRNPQPHNFPRGVFHLTADEQEAALEDLPTTMAIHFPHKTASALNLISDLLRGMFIAAPGYEFSSYDFAQIEMRLGAWYVGDEGLLEEFRGDGLVYEYTYATSFGIEKAAVTKDQRQIGKHLALGAQFGGGANALVATAWNLGRQKFDPDPTKAETIAEDLKVRWREAHPNFPAFWKQLEQAAKSAMYNPGHDVVTRPADRGVSYKVPIAADGTPAALLCCTLPSGRVISYPFPRIERRTVTKKDGTSWETESITYMVTDNGKWIRTATYGGKLFENIVQAAAADLLRFGVTNFNNCGVPVVLMVHDEVIAETRVGRMNWDSGRIIMEQSPLWCADLPIKVTGWQGARYRKE